MTRSDTRLAVSSTEKRIARGELRNHTFIFMCCAWRSETGRKLVKNWFSTKPTGPHHPTQPGGWLVGNSIPRVSDQTVLKIIFKIAFFLPFLLKDRATLTIDRQNLSFWSETIY